MVVKKNISTKVEEPSAGFFNALNKKLGSKETTVLTCKEVGALTDVIQNNDSYFLDHENPDSPSSAAFAVYNVNTCCDKPVLRFMQSQIPPSCYKGFVGIVKSPYNKERAEIAGIVNKADDNDYLSNALNFDE